MHNPFMYVPTIADELKKLDKSSAEYKKLMQRVLKSRFFSQAIMAATRDCEEAWFMDAKEKVIQNSHMLLIFIRIGVITALLALIAWIIQFGIAENIPLILLISAIVAAAFMFYYSNRVGKCMDLCAGMFLDRYENKAPHLSNERLITLVEIECSVKDFIEPSELCKQIPCGCYSCKSKFTSDKLMTVEGDRDYHCPECGKATVISERCGHEITDELLNDMHDYWGSED